MKINGRIYSYLKVWVIICVLLYPAMAQAEINFGGKIETNIVVTFDDNNNLMTIMQEHLQLDLLLPRMGDTSANFRANLYYEPQTFEGSPGLYGDISKLYIKHRFDNFHLTLGRQPIIWSFGSLFNPVDFNKNTGLIGLDIPEKGENAVVGYFPIDMASSFTAVVSFPEMSVNPKLGLRGRTDLVGYDLTFNYVNSPEVMEGLIPSYQQLGFTFKGDAGPFGLYGAMGYNYQTFSDGDLVFLLGGDYSFYLDNGSKILFQLEYLRDEARKSALIPEDPDLITGIVSYEIDEFSNISMAVVSNPHDLSFILVPSYKNLIGSGLDLNVSGVVFLGEEGGEFSPGSIISGMILPRGILKVGFSYPF